MKMKIVVGVDGSLPSKRAVEWCATYAAALGAEVVAVHAIDIPANIAPAMVSFPTPVMQISDADRADLEDIATREWCAPLDKATVPFRVIIRDGAPALVIMQAASDEDAELVVTGKRGRGGFAELILGSTSHVLSHHLDRPLVIVP
jgi:nucleotide-binding universal stress UspA family protein